jgi:hypothetical protein
MRRAAGRPGADEVLPEGVPQDLRREPLVVVEPGLFAEMGDELVDGASGQPATAPVQEQGLRAGRSRPLLPLGEPFPLKTALTVAGWRPCRWANQERYARTA